MHCKVCKTAWCRNTGKILIICNYSRGGTDCAQIYSRLSTLHNKHSADNVFVHILSSACSNRFRQKVGSSAVCEPHTLKKNWGSFVSVDLWTPHFRGLSYHPDLSPCPLLFLLSSSLSFPSFACPLCLKFDIHVVNKSQNRPTALSVTKLQKCLKKIYFANYFYKNSISMFLSVYISVLC